MPVMVTKRVPAVTRDLTQAFRKHRVAQHRRREGLGAAGASVHSANYPGSDPLLEGASSGPESAAKKASLPPRWVDFADRAKEDIKEIREQLAQLANAQERRLQRGDAGDAPEVEAISAAIATQIRVCEQSIHQVRTAGGGEGALLDDEFRVNTQRSLAAQLQQLSKQCRELQKGYMKEVKSRRQRSRNPGDLEAGISAAGGAPSTSGPVREQGMSQMQLLELENAEEFASQRSAEVAQIATSIEELNRIFRELAVMVIDQGSILDRIDYNTEKIYKRSDDGRKQMEKAVMTKRKNDSRAGYCFMWWVTADAVAFIILLIKWHLKYGLKNVLYFLVFLAAFCASMWYGWRYIQPLLCPKLTSCFQILPEGLDPANLWKKIRPGPVNCAKAAAAAGGGGVGGVGAGLNAMRHVWRPPGS